MDREERNDNANTVIKNHMIWSMGAGLIPVPIADFFAVSAIQLDMVRQLCKLYDVDFKENEGKAIITALTGSGVAKVGARIAIKFIPGLGSVVGGITMSVLSGASTYALGEAFKRHLETGGTFLDFDMDRLKKVYNEKFEKGKDYARKIKEEQERQREAAKKAEVRPDPEDPVERLKDLARLKQEGLITEEEYEAMKKKIISP